MAIGLDICSVKRIERMLFKWGDKFLDRFFSESEIEYIEGKNRKAQTVAGIFAAKEALLKTLGKEAAGFKFEELEVRYEENIPYAFYKGNKFSLSISHDMDMAAAVVFSDRKNLCVNSEIKLKKRDPFTHKGDYGRLGIFAGSSDMVGAAYFNACAAMRSGLGLSFLYVDEDIKTIMSIKLNESIVKKNNNIKFEDEKLDALTVGSGWGRDNSRAEIFNYILLNFEKKIVLDADALYFLSKMEKCDLKYRAVLTPHEGEMAMLLGKSIEEIKKDRIKYAREAEQKYKATVVLKGHRTIVCEKDKIYINEKGNAGMASAGSGDVLSGILGAFLAQGYSTFEAAKNAVYIHALAGDIAKERVSETALIASDIIENLKEAFLVCGG